MSPEAFPIRRVGEDFDRWGDLLALIRDAFAYMGPLIDPPSSAVRLTEQSLRDKAMAEVAFVAFDGDRPIACVFCSPEADDLYIGKLAVSPACQGRGLGRRLLNEAIAYAKQRGLSGLRLQIQLIDNHRTFERWGFVRTKETAHPGYGRPTTIEMRKTLPL